MQSRRGQMGHKRRKRMNGEQRPLLPKSSVPTLSPAMAEPTPKCLNWRAPNYPRAQSSCLWCGGPISGFLESSCKSPIFPQRTAPSPSWGVRGSCLPSSVGERIESPPRNMSPPPSCPQKLIQSGISSLALPSPTLLYSLPHTNPTVSHS